MQNIPYKTAEDILRDNCLDIENHQLKCQLHDIPLAEIEYKTAQNPESVKIINVTTHAAEYNDDDIAKLKDMAKVILELAIAAKHVNYQTASQIVNRILEPFPNSENRYVLHLDGNDFGQTPEDCEQLRAYMENNMKARVFVFMACCIRMLLNAANKNN